MKIGIDLGGSHIAVRAYRREKSYFEKGIRF